MNKSIFIDTNIFIDCIFERKWKTILDRAKSVGFILNTSITVIGEAIVKLRESEKSIENIISFMSILDDWDLRFLFPSHQIRTICYIMGNEEQDTRMINEVTDLTHLAYSMAYHVDIFITTDKNLKKYKITDKLKSIHFEKPDMCNLKEFQTAYLSK